MIKKILKIGLIILLVLIGVAFAAPLLFKNKIVAKVKESINKNLNAKVDFKDVDISLFRRFPRVSVVLDSLLVMGIGEFTNDTLLSANKLDISLDLISVIKGANMKVYAVILDAPRIHAVVKQDGNANWDILKTENVSSDTATASKPFSLELKQYSVNSGYISFADEKNDMQSEIVNLYHTGSGDFTSDFLILRTSTKADAVNLTLKGVPYLANTKLNIDADLQIDNKINKYQFETNNISINSLQLATRGFFQLINDSTYKMDISFEAPSNDFKNILSLVPVIYKKDFNKVNASGNAIFNGFVKGDYSSGRLPAYMLNLSVKNGFFQYADLPKPVKNINLKVEVSNADGLPDHTVINIPQGHVEMNNEPFDFRLMIKNPVSDMFIDGEAKGKIDFLNIAQFIKMESGTKLSGLIQANVSAKGNLSAIEKQQYEAFYAAGTIAVNGLQYASKDYPDGVKINNLFMKFNPHDVTINDLDGQYKRSNFSANGSVSNLLPYIFRGKQLGGKLSVQADQMNLNEWMGVPADPGTKSTVASEPFAVPSNINFDIDASIGRLIYDKLEIQQLSGNVVMKDESVVLNDINGGALDGSMMINGTYSTRENKKNPQIYLDYNVNGLDVQKTFYAFNSIQQLMPIGQYLSGKLSSRMNVAGNLEGNMMPDLRSLTGAGNLLLIEGFLKKFAPLEKLADLLNVKELKEISLKDVKNYVEFTKGMVLVKPFTIKHKGIEMIVGGMHGLDQSLDYIIDLKIPRALIGDKGNAFVNSLVTQVNSKGIPIKVGETVNLHVKMGGTIKSPQFKIDLKEAAENMADRIKQQAIDFAKAKIDSSKKLVVDTALSVKRDFEKQVREDLKKVIAGDTSKNVGAIADSSKAKMQKAGKGMLEELLKRKRVN